jgi:DNA-binding protein YbaB
MTYIPKEAQDTIDRLQEELLKVESERDEAQATVAKLRKSGSGFQSGFWMVLILLLAGLAYLFYAYGTGAWPIQGHGSQEKALQTQVDSLQNKLMLLQEEAAQAGASINFSEGLWYFVQIGAYEQLDLSMFEENMFNFRQRQEDGLHKYTLGAFRDLARAETFLQSVRTMGIPDAWLLVIHQGERLTIEASKAISTSEIPDSLEVR